MTLYLSRPLLCNNEIQPLTHAIRTAIQGLSNM